MTIALLFVLSYRRPYPATALRYHDPATELLFVTARYLPPDTVVLEVCGAVDAFTGPPAQDRLLTHLRNTVPQVIVDLTGVIFLGAPGLTVLMRVREAAEAAGSSLSVAAHTRAVLLPLVITGLADVLDIYPRLADALLRLGHGPATT